MKFELRIGQRIGVRFGGGVRRFDQVANPPPHVNLVRNLGPENVVAVISWLVGGSKRPVCRLLVGSDVADRVDLRKSSSERLQGAGLRRVVCCDGRCEIGIGSIDLSLEIVERPVVECVIARAHRIRFPALGAALAGHVDSHLFLLPAYVAGDATDGAPARFRPREPCAA